MNNAALRTLLGYLNFSSGAADAQFQRTLNEVFGELECAAGPDGELAWIALGKQLASELTALAGRAPGFESTEQVAAVLRLVFDRLLPAYRSFHRDLLAHQTEAELFRPFFIAQACQAVLEQEAPWSDDERIISGALRSLNSFIGHRPVAALRTAQKIEPYRHEWVAPIPLYLAGAGLAVGRYENLLAATLEVLRSTDRQILDRAHFDPDLLAELALDPRAYDFDHPANKRPNYHFGQWDPHTIDNAGQYRRYVLQAVTLDALLERVAESPDNEEDLLTEAAVVLAGTILMGAGVSGRGPGAHDSTTTLSTLLPRIAAYRDDFYAARLTTASGPPGEHLRAEANMLRQPFGGARQDLNQRLARLRATQLQHVHLARLFAAMGNLEASSRQARIVPVASARMLSDISGRITVGHLALQRGDLACAVRHLDEIDDLIKRGIQCGALVDPWNILGFQGQFSLFPALENSVRDHRVDVLIHLVAQTLALGVQAAGEAAATGAAEELAQVRDRLSALAAWWDRFATRDVSGVESISGRESVEAADAIAGALAAWHQAGATGGDIAFWRQHVGRFESPRAYSLVIETLLAKHDFVAAMGLLVQWLSEAEHVALAEGKDSFHRLSERYLSMLTAADVDPAAAPGATLGRAPRELVAKFFDFLEANAGVFWTPPLLSWAAGEDEAAPHDEDEDETNPYEAAYEGVTYLDTTDDGVEGATVEGGQHPSDFELEIEAARLRPRVAFLSTLARLRTLVAMSGTAGDDLSAETVRSMQEFALLQLSHAKATAQGLTELLTAVDRYRIPEPTSAQTSLVEYDRRRRAKESLMAEVASAAIEATGAVRWLEAASGEDFEAFKEATRGPVSSRPRWRGLATAVLRGIRQGDPEQVRRAFPLLRAALEQLPILYVPLARGGDPVQFVETQEVKHLLLELLVVLPRLGLLTEACQIINTAMAMEQHRPKGEKAITEFDRLFETGYRALVESLIDAAGALPAEGTRAGVEAASDVELVECLQWLTEPLLRRWLEHSRSVRLSVMEKLAEPERWSALVAFVERYGHDLFTQRFLNLGNLRAIIDQGADAYLHLLEEEPDPTHPIALVDDLDRGIARSVAVEQLQTIVEAVVENYGEYKDFNTTTTHSDRGEMLYMLLDFLRLKSSYERVCWNIRPVVQAHEILMRRGRIAAAELWRRALSERTSEVADLHLKQQKELVERYRMRLASVAARLAERFVRPLAIDRLRALVSPAIAAVHGDGPPDAFDQLELEIGEFADQPSGSGLEVPSWLMALEEEAARAQASPARQDPADKLLRRLPALRLTLADISQQLRDVDEQR